MYPRTIIDSLSAVPNRDQLTHKDLHAHFSTGQSILLSGSGRDKKYGYRNGMLRSVAVCAFLDLRIPSGSGKITEKKLRTHQVGIEGILHFGRISM